jgi:hypothetical protein
MSRVSLALAALAACAPDQESYPDAWSRASSVCGEELTAECEEVIREDLGDDHGYLVESVYEMFAYQADPWFYNMVAGLVDHVELGELATTEADADAEYHRWTNTIEIHDPWKFGGILGASAVVHEAGHGRPLDHGHIRCPSDGAIQCDDHLGGAVGTQLMFVDEMIGNVGFGDDSLIWFRDQVESRLLVP